MGKHEEHIVDFVQKVRINLEHLPSAFFSVSLAAHGDMERARLRRELRAADRLASNSGWSLQRRRVIPRVRVLQTSDDEEDRERKARRLSTDTSRDHVYTDLDEVKRFAEHSWNHWFQNTCP